MVTVKPFDKDASCIILKLDVGLAMALARAMAAKALVALGHCMLTVRSLRVIARRSGDIWRCISGHLRVLRCGSKYGGTVELQISGDTKSGLASLASFDLHDLLMPALCHLVYRPSYQLSKRVISP